MVGKGEPPPFMGVVKADDYGDVQRREISRGLFFGAIVVAGLWRVGE